MRHPVIKPILSRERRFLAVIGRLSYPFGIASFGFRFIVAHTPTFTYKHFYKNSVKVNNCCSCFRTSSNLGMNNKTITVEEKKQSNESPIIWIDLEMTGLDVEKEKIIEIACLVTDGDLQLIAKGPNLIIHQSDGVLNNMNEWCVRQHGQSGLTDAVRKSNICTAEAERQVLEFLKQYTEEKQCPLAGNSVYTDKLFIEKYMPLLAQHLHYRIIDVSSVKELCRRWYPQIFKSAPSKKETHRAMDDILESLDELKFYRSSIFKCL